MASVLIPSSLRRYTRKEARVEICGSSISEVLANLTAGSAEMRGHLFASDALRNFVVVTKNSQDIRLLDGLATPVASGDEIRILASIAGG